MKTICTHRFERHGVAGWMQAREFPVTRMRFYWWSADKKEWFGPFTTTSAAYANVLACVRHGSLAPTTA